MDNKFHSNPFAQKMKKTIEQRAKNRALESKKK